MWLFWTSYSSVPGSQKEKKNKDKFQGAKRSLISSVPWESLHPREEGLAAVRGGGQCQNTGLYLFICSSVIRKVKVLFAQLCQILWDSMDFSLPGSSVHGTLQARILDWVAMPSSRAASQLKDWTHVSCISCIAGKFFTAEPPGEAENIL